MAMKTTLPVDARPASEITGVYSLPRCSLLRLPQIIGDPKAKPPIPALIPVARSTWFAGVKDGRFPKPVKLGPRTAAWRLEAILALINGQDGEAK